MWELGTPTEWQKTTIWPLQRMNLITLNNIKPTLPLICHSIATRFAIPFMHAYTVYSIRRKLSLHKTIAPIPGLNLLM